MLRSLAGFILSAVGLQGFYTPLIIAALINRKQSAARP
jgi:hypothetical protein